MIPHMREPPMFGTGGEKQSRGSASQRSDFCSGSHLPGLFRSVTTVSGREGIRRQFDDPLPRHLAV